MAERQRPRDMLIEIAHMARGGHDVGGLVPKIDAALELIPKVDERDILDALLTSAEHRAIKLAAELWNVIVQDVAGDGPSRENDLAELAADIHRIQERVLAQAGARAFPSEYRLLGEVLEAPHA